MLETRPLRARTDITITTTTILPCHQGRTKKEDRKRGGKKPGKIVHAI
jgi:hypothetical protein